MISMKNVKGATVLVSNVQNVQAVQIDGRGNEWAVEVQSKRPLE
jgi:hypothetical protein